ncbi:MAG: helix-turn-helix domain-containing protein [Deltaproteobacteria bacterium]|nr:helix-turn-helix domain-containing protein [Deltaproteobacteria bacterium]
MVEIDDRWLSVDEMCKYLGVSSDTIYRWIDRFSMPAHRMGRLWKFKKDEVDGWVKAGGATEQNKGPKTENE